MLRNAMGGGGVWGFTFTGKEQKSSCKGVWFNVISFTRGGRVSHFQKEHELSTLTNDGPLGCLQTSYMLGMFF